MKKILSSLFLLLIIAISASANVKLTSADWRKLVGQEKVAVVLVLDELKYKKTHPFKEFLHKENRVKNWQSESLAYFISNFNKKLAALGMEAFEGSGKDDTKYSIKIVPKNVTSGGKLSGIVGVCDNVTNECIVSFSFDTNDGDDDDEITFRDPMRELGEDIGKIFVKGLKKQK